MSIKVRTNVFETNSSSTHTLVIPTYGHELYRNEVDVVFPAKMYSFGRTTDCWTDASHKFAYLWQHLCSKITFINKNMKRKKNLQEKRQRRKIPDYIENRFQKFKDILSVIAERIKANSHIALDFSDLAIVHEEGRSWYLSSKSSYMCDVPWLDSSLEPHFRTERTAEIINDALSSDKEFTLFQENKNPKKLPDLSGDGYIIMECFRNMLEFAFDENSLIISHGDTISDEELVCEKMIVEYVSRNKGHCLIAKAEGH